MTIGTFLKDKGITVSVNNDIVSIKHAKKKAEKPVGRDFVHLTRHFKQLEQHAREQYQKSVIGGYDADYILKSSSELGSKEPTFEWQKGNLVFVPRQKKKTA